MGRAAESFSVLIRNHIIKKNPVKTPLPTFGKYHVQRTRLENEIVLGLVVYGRPILPWGELESVILRRVTQDQSENHHRESLFDTVVRTGKKERGRKRLGRGQVRVEWSTAQG